MNFRNLQEVEEEIKGVAQEKEDLIDESVQLKTKLGEVSKQFDNAVKERQVNYWWYSKTSPSKDLLDLQLSWKCISFHISVTRFEGENFSLPFCSTKNEFYKFQQ